MQLCNVCACVCAAGWLSPGEGGFGFSLAERRLDGGGNKGFTLAEM